MEVAPQSASPLDEAKLDRILSLMRGDWLPEEISVEGRRLLPPLLVGFYSAKQKGLRLTKKDACGLMNVDPSTTGPKYIDLAIKMGWLAVDRREGDDGRKTYLGATDRLDAIVGGQIEVLTDDASQLALESKDNVVFTVQRQLKEGVAIFSTGGVLRLSNLAFARIWGFHPVSLARGPHIDEVIRHCRKLYDDEPTWTLLKRAVILADEGQRIEGSMSRPDGSVIAYEVLPLPEGGVLLTFVDITDTKRVERALVERNEALEIAHRLKSQFISHVSYELRTPLINIIGFSELLMSPRAGELNDKQREYLGDIGASSKTLLAIINDILDLATIDAGGFELKLAPVSAATIIEGATQGVRERMARGKLMLDLRIAPDVDTFIADEQRVKQVLYNLLSNAIGFSEVGDTVTLSCAREAGMIIFSVKDQGAGISEEHQRRLFEPFESRTQGSKHRGAGLGLALVKSLVELHGGDVRLVSVVGKGTEVTVRFPEDGGRAAKDRAKQIDSQSERSMRNRPSDTLRRAS